MIEPLHTAKLRAISQSMVVERFVVSGAWRSSTNGSIHHDLVIHISINDSMTPKITVLHKGCYISACLIVGEWHVFDEGLSLTWLSQVVLSWTNQWLMIMTNLMVIEYIVF